MTSYDDTICAPATSVGTGAISVIRVSGRDALAVADAVIAFKTGAASSSEGYTLKYGEVPGIDDVLVSVFRAPHSYTGEDSVEISCHASSYVVSEVLERLVKAGARMAQPGEFTRRAFVGGKMDLAQAEAVADLIASSSAASHRLALTQLKGGISRELKDLRASLLELTSLLELELDFSEEDVEFAQRSQLASLLEKIISKVSTLSGSFRVGNAIRSGVPVAIAGPVNAGKSTLLNALLGEDRAIVSSEEGTTRDTVEEVMTLQGIQFRFIDTAGLRQTHGKVEQMGIERSLKTVSNAHIVLCLLDATASVEDDAKVLGQLLPLVDLREQKLLILRNKVDLFDAITPEEFPSMDRSYGVLELKYPAFGTWRLSPDELRGAIASALEDGPQRGILGSLRAPSTADTLDPATRARVLQVLEGAVLMDISAFTGEGLDALRSALCSSVSIPDGESVLVSNARHHEALQRALSSLLAVQRGMHEGLSGDLLAEDLRESLRHLGSITGQEISADEVLGSIFGRFCIGK